MKLRIQRIIAAAFMLLLFATNLRANDIQISNISLTGENTTDDYVMVQFDLSWENSWRYSTGPANWDAAWVFIKYRVGAGEWQHASLNNTGHSGTAATIAAGLRTPGSAFDATTNPAVGVFIYRSADGTGTFSITGAQLRWNYGANGVADNATADVMVFAIEMVYVPEGAFAAGSGGSELLCFTLTTINTADATMAPTGTGGFNGSAQGGYPTGQTAPANAAWPNGFAAFYCQKYEITQQQYVDFLNTLTQTQANLRKSDKTSPNYRYEITGSSVGSYATTNPYVACNYLSWMDGAAYLDWAGLRPMTELEFEKACRGTATPVPNEYAWGNTTIAAAMNISNAGASNETPSNPGANAVYENLGTGGPLRVGAFATGNSTRTEAGASYYGIMELSGNLTERPVTIGNVAGRSYTGLHGNGGLNTSGDADVSFWPGINGNSSPGIANTAYGGTTGVTHAAGSGLRGGNWTHYATGVRASGRGNAEVTDSGREAVHGFRGVRGVP